MIKPTVTMATSGGMIPLYDGAAIEAAVLAEREACAKVCEDLIENFAEHTCAAAIRSRGNKLNNH